jgi:hypothetical protein
MLSSSMKLRGRARHAPNRRMIADHDAGGKSARGRGRDS